MIGDSPLSAFPHHGLPRDRDPFGRLAALAATILLYGALVLLALRGFVWVVTPQPPQQADTTVRLLPSPPRPRIALQDFTIRLIKPQVENAPVPEIVIRPDVTPAPKSTLPATAALVSPMAGGSASGIAGGVSGIGTGGAGKGVSACMDPVYLEQIMRHVSRWYLYPDLARQASGIAYVHFVIDSSGRYQSLTLVRGTGNDWLDGAAMRTMRQAEPLPPIPERFHTDRLDGVMPIVYQRGGQKLLPQQLGGLPGGC